MINNLPVKIHNGTKVMSSVDLARLCVGDTKDAHSDFMKKARKVLGDKLGNFSEHEKYAKGTRKILLLPEREACLMAMSYSYELQAMVYDRWKALETGQAKPAAQLDYRPEAAKIKSLIDEGVLTKQDAYKWATGSDSSANSEKPKESQEDIEAGINFCVERLQLLLDKHPDMTVREVEAFHAQNKDFFGGYNRDKYLRPAMEIVMPERKRTYH